LFKEVPYYFNKYWKDVGNVKSYWEANLDLLNNYTRIFLGSFLCLKNPWHVGAEGYEID